MLCVVSFAKKFVKWIEGYITSPWFSIAINGSIAGFFLGKRGVRQCDVLSPYLFFLAMQVLSKLLDEAVEEVLIVYHLKCRGLKLTHLCYADDLLVFTARTINSILALKMHCNISMNSLSSD